MSSVFEINQFFPGVVKLFWASLFIKYILEYRTKYILEYYDIGPIQEQIIHVEYYNIGPIQEQTIH